MSVKKPAPQKKKHPPSPSEQVVKWINDHPLFKWSTMCVDNGISKGNFHRILHSKRPHIEYYQLVQVEEVISEYGFKKITV